METAISPAPKGGEPQNIVNLTYERNIVNIFNKVVGACDAIKVREYSVIEYEVTNDPTKRMSSKKDSKSVFGIPEIKIPRTLDYLFNADYENLSTNNSSVSSNGYLNVQEFYSKNKQKLRINSSNNQWSNYLFPAYLDLTNSIFLSEREEFTDRLILKIEYSDINNSSKSDNILKINDDLEIPIDIDKNDKDNLQSLSSQEWYQIEKEHDSFYINNVVADQVYSKEKSNYIFNSSLYKEELERIKTEQNKNPSNIQKYDYGSNYSYLNDLTTGNIPNIKEKEIDKFKFYVNSRKLKDTIKIKRCLFLYNKNISNVKNTILYLISDYGIEGQNLRLYKNTQTDNAESDNISFIPHNFNGNNFRERFQEYFLKEYDELMRIMHNNQHQADELKNLNLDWYFDKDFYLNANDYIFIEAKTNLDIPKVLFQLDRSYNDNIKHYPKSKKKIFIAILSNKQNRVLTLEHKYLILEFLKSGKMLFILNIDDNFLGVSIKQWMIDPSVYLTSEFFLDLIKSRDQEQRLTLISLFENQNSQIEKLGTEFKSILTEQGIELKKELNIIINNQGQEFMEIVRKQGVDFNKIMIEQAEESKKLREILLEQAKAQAQESKNFREIMQAQAQESKNFREIMQAQAQESKNFREDMQAQAQESKNLREDIRNLTDSLKNINLNLIKNFDK